jgi:8-oxo-dGTP pyrophosphatase MutT (NUDIX family)
VSEAQTSRTNEAELASILAGREIRRGGDLDPRGRGSDVRPLVAASVLVLLERGPDWHMVLTKRTTSVDLHKGEVSFAGGMRDPGDADVRATALREAHEEIGLDPLHVTVLGEIDELVTVTGFVVTPVVAIVDPDHVYRPNPGEVERVLRVPLEHLRDANSWFEDVRTWGDRTYVLRSCRFGDDIIWGATSRMLQNFLEIVPPHLLR